MCLPSIALNLAFPSSFIFKSCMLTDCAIISLDCFTTSCVYSIVFSWKAVIASSKCSIDFFVAVSIALLRCSETSENFRSLMSLQGSDDLLSARRSSAVSVEEFLLSGGPSSSAAVRVAVIHDIKVEEGERQ